MDKFQSELLAQLKEHNRLTKELVKIERANLELSKDINNVNSSLADVIIPHNLGTYCGVDASVIDIHANRSISDFLPDEIEKEPENQPPTLIRFNIDIDDLARYVIQSLIHDEQFHDIFFTRVSNTPTFNGNMLKDAIRVSMKDYVNEKYLKEGEEDA